MVTTPNLTAEIAAYRDLLQALVAAQPAAARLAATDLLAAGEAPERVYRVVARTLLARTSTLPALPDTAPSAWPDGLLALNAALFLSAALPPPERTSLFADAIGQAVAGQPARASAPSAMPVIRWHTARARQSGAATTRMRHAGPPDSATADQHATAGAESPASGLLRSALLVGDGPSAEWALAHLLAGPDGGTLPGESIRRTAYTALFLAAAAASRSTDGGRLLVIAQHAAEMAELLPPSLTLLALRPALRAIAAARHSQRVPTPAAGRARSVQPGAATARTTPLSMASSAPALTPQALECALRVNRRAARPGETPQWAQALRTRPVARVVEEALASGLAAHALLDAAVLASLLVPPPHAALPDALQVQTTTVRTLLALHAARRAYVLGDDTCAAPMLGAALNVLDHLARTVPAQHLTLRHQSRALLNPPATRESAPTPASLARAAARHASPQAILLAEATLAEYEAALPH
ncbi:MAG TPA: hypothetical protein VID73_11430, partial [Ktedonobacterales bacterium]